MTDSPHFSRYQDRVALELRRVVPTDSGPVERAMAYTVLAPSKQVRAVLVLLCAELCRGNTAQAVPAAVAIEVVHAASLILDDLPSMDDAPLRRGRRANHLESGEAVAILAAFGLLNLAYGTLARAYDPAMATRMASILSDAVGPAGLIGGQALDLQATDQQISFETLERIHRGKTGALFVAAAGCGAVTAGAAGETIAALSAYAKNLGLAFQIVDDLLDVSGDPAANGKAVRVDARKTTFVSFSGVDGARQLAAELCETADRALAPFGAKADRLRELSAFVSIETAMTDPRIDDLRQQLKSLGYLDAGVDRFLLAPARDTRGPVALAARASVRVGLLGGVLLGPAAAIGLGARLPGLISGVRDAGVLALYLGVLFFLAVTVDLVPRQPGRDRAGAHERRCASRGAREWSPGTPA